MGDAPAPLRERWWEILWFLWGVTLATVIAVLDRNPLASCVATIAGVVIGQYGLRVLWPSCELFHRWYKMTFGNPDNEREALRLLLLGRYKEELERSDDDELWILSLELAPMMGIVHGTLLGTIAGALCAIDRECGLTATRGALLGAVVGPPFIAAVVAVMVALLWPRRYLPTKPSRAAQRWLILISPIFFFPAALYAIGCLMRFRDRTFKPGSQKRPT